MDTFLDVGTPRVDFVAFFVVSKRFEKNMFFRSIKIGKNLKKCKYVEENKWKYGAFGWPGSRGRPSRARKIIGTRDMERGEVFKWERGKV